MNRREELVYNDEYAAYVYSQRKKTIIIVAAFVVIAVIAAVMINKSDVPARQMAGVWALLISALGVFASVHKFTIIKTLPPTVKVGAGTVIETPLDQGDRGAHVTVRTEDALNGREVVAANPGSVEPGDYVLIASGSAFGHGVCFLKKKGTEFGR